MAQQPGQAATAQVQQVQQAQAAAAPQAAPQQQAPPQAQPQPQAQQPPMMLQVDGAGDTSSEEDEDEEEEYDEDDEEEKDKDGGEDGQVEEVGGKTLQIINTEPLLVHLSDNSSVLNTPRTLCADELGFCSLTGAAEQRGRCQRRGGQRAV